MNENDMFNDLFSGMGEDADLTQEDDIFSGNIKNDVNKDMQEARKNHMKPPGRNTNTRNTQNSAFDNVGSPYEQSSPYERAPKADINDPDSRLNAMGMGQNQTEGEVNDQDRLNDYETGQKQSKIVDLLAVVLTAFGATKLMGKLANRFGIPNPMQQEQGQSGQPGQQGYNPAGAPGQQSQQANKMTWGQRLAMIIVAMVGLFAVLSFATFMINTLTSRETNHGVEGFQTVVQNIHKGGTVEGINNPNKKVWTIEERKAMPFTYDGNYLAVRNEVGAEDYYTYADLPGAERSEIPEGGYVWVRYIIDNDTKEILDAELDGLVTEDDPYQDGRITLGEDGEIIEIKKDRLKEGQLGSKKLTQSEYDALSETDKELYNIRRAEEELDKHTAEEEQKIGVKIKNKAVEVRDSFMATIYNVLGKEYQSEKDKKPKRRQFKINPIKEDGTQKTKEEINREIKEMKKEMP